MGNLKGQERLIVALDTTKADAALDWVKRLNGTVNFYKIGWGLFMSGEWIQLVRALEGKDVFFDLKLPVDIGATLGMVVERCADLGIKFVTLSDDKINEAARIAIGARKDPETPRLLCVPYLSSLDESDLESVTGRRDTSLSDYMIERSRVALEAGCDGIIVSGKEIGLIRDRVGTGALIVSPGIRPKGFPSQDHKRVTTPAEAIKMGADYLVVGRPITQSTDGPPEDAARRIIDEIDEALQDRKGPSAGGSYPTGPQSSMAARPAN